MRGGAFGTVLTLLAALSLQTGEFSQTCTDISVTSKGVLSAECRNVYNSPVDSSLDLNINIANIDGRLQAVESNGNFAKTCKNIKINGDNTLVAECKTRKGEYRSTSFNLDENVANINGYLTWESSSAIRNPIRDLPHLPIEELPKEEHPKEELPKEVSHSTY